MSIIGDMSVPTALEQYFSKTQKFGLTFFVHYDIQLGICKESGIDSIQEELNTVSGNNIY